jgi:[ribosomal protein S18]-alanine N-acetyltransferase
VTGESRPPDEDVCRDGTAPERPSPTQSATAHRGEPAGGGEAAVVVPHGFLIRPMTVWDIPEVLQHEQTLFPLDAWPPEFYEAELAQAGPHGSVDLAGKPTTRDYRVLVRDETADTEAGHYPGDIVGYGGIMVAGDVADVQTIGTAAEVQGRGLGAAQLAWMVAEAAHRGAESLMLEVRASNEPARRLYARHGFAHIHTRRRYYPGGEDALIMRRELTAADRSAGEAVQGRDEGTDVG